MRILILSAYPAESHRRWQRGLMQAFSEFDWVLLELPPRFFAWRSRGNSLTWGLGNFPELDESYDLLIATSMVDLTALRGFRPALARLPTIVYVHENQFAYPELTHQKGRLELQMTTIYTALVADALVFNSAFNRDTFLAGSGHLLKSMPDGVPSQVFSKLEQRAQVLPVPLEDSCWSGNHLSWRQNKNQLAILWNHRWEQDKNPEGLLLGIQRYLEQRKPMAERSDSSCQNAQKQPSITLKFHIVGQQFRQRPAVFDTLKSLLEHHGVLGQWGFIDSVSEYSDLLHQSDIVLSTAWHDFQGLSILEAVAAGCYPLVPNRLVYPEWFDEHFLYASFPDEPTREAAALADALLNAETSVKREPSPSERGHFRHPSALSDSVQSFQWQRCKKNYARLFHKVIRRAM